MTQSEVVTAKDPVPGPRAWRRTARLAAVLVIPIVAMLLWPGPSAAESTTSGRLDVPGAVPAHLVPNAARAIGVNAAIQAQIRRTGLCALHVGFCRYRGLYRQVGRPLLILGAIALPCWVAFRLYRRRTAGRPRSARREILLLAAVVYLLCVAALTLTPNRNSRLRAEPTAGVELRPSLASLACSPASLYGAPNARSFCLQNAAGNVALFFPLGVLIPLIWSGLRFWRGMQIALALSIGIELIQYFSRAWGSYRSADVNDVILNGVGACLGLALVTLLRSRREIRPAVPRA